VIPGGSAGVDSLAARILIDLIPKAADAYTMADLGMLAGLVKMVGQDFDRAADVLVSDLEAARAIFRDAAANIQDGDLKRRMAEVVASRPESLAIPVLNAHADTAMRVLIDLHAAAEDALDAGAHWAPALDRRIWAFLDEYVAKRAYDSAF
jgi:ABC-type ATPase with predicted acetyltransferase domain